MHNKTFRLFISSTFSDFSREREYMQTQVFPAVEAICASFGYQFQAIDLRWGVNEEAQLDQKTIEICLNEVKTCKHYPHPNFLIMIGNRYGWIPLPYTIERTEFEKILDYYPENSEQRDFLNEWYEHDLNHLIGNNSTAFVLKPRTGKFTDYHTWATVEERLRILLQEAVAGLSSITERDKYFLSATEHEVINGVFSYLDATGSNRSKKEAAGKDCTLDIEYVYGFIREIIRKNMEKEGSLWHDPDDEMVNRFKSSLRRTLLTKNTIELETRLVTPARVDEHYLPLFTAAVLNFLMESVSRQIDTMNRISDVLKVCTENQMFKKEKLRVFIGRENVLGRIDDYIQSVSTAPLVVFGESGMGKSALIAKAVDNAEQKDNGKVIFRFVGVSENSGDIRSLLLSIIREAGIPGADDLERIFNDDTFSEQVAKALEGIKERTVIFIDALDQLVEKSWLKWLPSTLPPHLRMIISVLKDKNYEKDSTYLDQLKAIYSEDRHRENFIELPPLTRIDGKEMLAGLLKGLNRTITAEQEEYVLDQFEQSGCSPLFMTVALEEIRNWKSFSPHINTTLDTSVTGGIKTFIRDLSVVYHHQDIFVSRVLGYIECSRYGLSEKEILDILSSDHDVMKVFESQYHKNLSGCIPVAPWARLYTQLSPFLAEKTADEVSLITMFHRQFRSAIQTEILADTNSRKDMHLRLAQYFQRQKLVTSEGVFNLRKLSEQAYQLYHSDRAMELLELIEDDYIRVKHNAGRFYDCLNDIELAFILLNTCGSQSAGLKERLFASLIKFFSTYSSGKNGLFDFEIIHAYFVYRNRSDFYEEFLNRATTKEYTGEFFSDAKLATDYHLLFLTSFVGFLRRKSRLKEAGTYVHDIIGEYFEKVKCDPDNHGALKQLSTAYYELGYISYLTGNFREADDAFSQSVSYAHQCNNIVGEWITKCVMKRIGFIGGLSTIDDFNNTLDEAFKVFKSLESTNHAAKRWVMNVMHHKFEVGFIRNDLKMMKYYYEFIRTNEWNLEHNVPMDLFEAQIAMRDKDYEKAIGAYNSWLGKMQQKDIRKTEAFADIYFQLGIVYDNKGDSLLAKQFLQEALSLDDEPANHIPKQKARDYLDKITC